MPKVRKSRSPEPQAEAVVGRLVNLGALRRNPGRPASVRTDANYRDCLLQIARRIASDGLELRDLTPETAEDYLQQSMREWAEQRAVPHRYVGICSDTRAGRNDEDASLHELEIPVTTDPAAISEALRAAPSEAMTVVFCTYHSLGLVEQAQDGGAPPFDLILCDEAHRTTGVERPGDKTSPFILVHDAARIGAKKRLYMTATPRLYTEGAKAKAADHAVEVFSMDDPETYGPQFHRLPFSRAVEQDLLSDYKVVVLAMSEDHVAAALQAHLATGEGGEINLDDAAEIVGCWRALQNPENLDPAAGTVRPLGRAIAFTNTIKASQRLEAHWPGLVEQAVSQLPQAERDGAFRCETRHVDGQHHALDRKARIEWLKGSTEGDCRILSNARCLSEGIDVPALDAVLFMSPRSAMLGKLTVMNGQHYARIYPVPGTGGPDAHFVASARNTSRSSCMISSASAIWRANSGS